MPIVNVPDTREGGECRRKAVYLQEHRGQPYPRVTISMLPDEVLLELFNFYVNRYHNDDAWHILVHVCRRWRSIVFASPRRLHLALLCTDRRLLEKTLDIWPALPIVIRSRVISPRNRGMTHIIAALTGHNVVRGIHIHAIPTSLLEQFAAFKNTLPVLTDLTLSSHERNPPSLIDSFLGGSAPRLQNLDLRNIPYPGLGKLLSSTSHLANLSLWDISYSRYTSPGVMATSLSTSARLKKLVLHFLSLSYSFIRNPPPPTTVVLPALTYFYFSGNSEYLEDFLSRIDAPLLSYIIIYIAFSTPPPPGPSLLRLFLSRTEAFKTSHQVDILFYGASAKVTLFQQKRESDHKLQEFQLSYELMNWPLNRSLPRLCGSFLPPLLTVERLCISHFGEHPEEDQTAQWLELLAPFISVRDLNISCSLSVVAPALGELTGERTIEVLPALQNVFVGHLPSEDHVREALARFTAVRQLSGRPVTIRYEGR